MFCLRIKLCSALLTEENSSINLFVELFEIEAQSFYLLNELEQMCPVCHFCCWRASQSKQEQKMQFDAVMKKRGVMRLLQVKIYLT